MSGRGRHGDHPSTLLGRQQRLGLEIANPEDRYEELRRQLED
jgi:hypothetical protein